MRKNIPANGFTLVEILVAIVVISLAFGAVISSFSAIGRKTRDQQRITDLQNIQSALLAYYADQHFYPGSQPANRFNVESAPDLTSSSGNLNPPSLTKTYLAPIPHEPQQPATGWSYCYEGFRSSIDYKNNIFKSCGDVTTPCQYYALYATLEASNLPLLPNQGQYCGGGHNYNYQITAERSAQ